MGCVLSVIQICLPDSYYDPDDQEKKVVYANTDQDYGQKLTGTGTWTNAYIVQPGGQPRRRSMLIYPPMIDGVPEGFETFVDIGAIFIQKNHPFYRIMTNFKNKTTYTVQNKKAEYMLFAAQEVATSTFSDQCLELCSNYPYVLHVADNCEREVMRIKKKAKCNCFLTCLGCTNCGANECIVECPPGEKLGTITQRRSFCAYSFTAHDADGRLLYDIEGPCFLLDYLYCGRRQWSIRNMFGLKVAGIEKVWVKNGNNPDHRNEAYEISCPNGLAAKRKALFLAMTFFMDSISY